MAYFFRNANNYANEAETSLKLFQAVSVFYFSFISECATGFGVPLPVY